MPAVKDPSDAELAPAASALVRRLAAAALALGLLAAVIGLHGRPPAVTSFADAAILFIHVPAAWLSLALFAVAVASAADLLRDPARLPVETLAAVAPVGATAAFVALWTGLDGPQAQGAGWGWDARLVTELLLLLLFAGLMSLRSAIAEPQRASRAGSVLVLVAALNIPMIYLSVDWWRTLHERAAASVGRSPVAVAAMVVMTLAFCLYAGAMVLVRLDSLARKRDAGKRCFATVRAEGASAPATAKE